MNICTHFAGNCTTNKILLLRVKTLNHFFSPRSLSKHADLKAFFFNGSEYTTQTPQVINKPLPVTTALPLGAFAGCRVSQGCFDSFPTRKSFGVSCLKLSYLFVVDYLNSFAALDTILNGPVVQANLSATKHHIQLLVTLIACSHDFSKNVRL